MLHDPQVIQKLNGSVQGRVRLRSSWQRPGPPCTPSPIMAASGVLLSQVLLFGSMCFCLAAGVSRSGRECFPLWPQVFLFAAGAFVWSQLYACSRRCFLLVSSVFLSGRRCSFSQQVFFVCRVRFPLAGAPHLRSSATFK